MAGLCHLRRLACSEATRLGLAPSRSFGAAALQYDYDYCYDEEEEASGGSWNDRLRLALRANACSTTVGRGVQWVLMGSPGVQKHVYAARLSKLLEVPHISMGSLVRQELSPRSSLYKQIANAVNKGKLVPEEVIFGLLSKRLEEGYYQGETGFILDGIPRTRIQAEILDQIADIDLVVNFKCKEECSFKKELGAGLCSHCGESFNLSSTEFAGVSPCSHHLQLKSSVACTDDAHKEKLQIYTEQSKPLEDYYRKQRKLLDFQVAGEPGDAWHGLLAALRLQHMDIESTPKKITA